jgi:hypothetical protein
MDRRILDEARAKIFWGETPEEVRRFLLSHDGSRREADQAVAGFLGERHREIRRTGIRKVVIGAVLLGTSLGGLAVLWSLSHHPMLGKRGGGYLLALVLLGLFFGIGKIVDGVFYVFRPQLETKSVSDLSD